MSKDTSTHKEQVGSNLASSLLAAASPKPPTNLHCRDSQFSRADFGGSWRAATETPPSVLPEALRIAPYITIESTPATVLIATPIIKW